MFWPRGLLLAASHFATPGGLYIAAGLRVGIGLVLLLAARGSLTPNLLRVLGVLAFVGGLATPLVGVERVRAILDWCSHQGPIILRLGAAFALALGSFIAYAVLSQRREA